jgi:hypothetical protein
VFGRPRCPGRRPLAPHGECQLPRCGSQIHAPSPRRGRLRHQKSRLADRRRAHPVLGHLRREDTNAAILKQAETGRLYSPDIAGALFAGFCEASEPMCSACARTRSNNYLPWLDMQWAAGHHNGAGLWRCLKAKGFRVRCGLLQNGRHAVGAPKRRMLRAYSVYHPQEPSPA